MTTAITQEAHSTRLEPLLRSIDGINRVGGVVSGAVCLIMAIHVLADVIGRSIFQTPLPGTLDISTYIYMPMMIFLSLGAAERVRQHITVTLVQDSMTGAWRQRADAVAGSFAMIAVAALLYFAFLRTLTSVGLQEAIVGQVNVPVWPSSITMTVGFVMLILQVLVTIVRSASGLPEAEHNLAEKGETVDYAA